MKIRFVVLAVMFGIAACWISACGDDEGADRPASASSSRDGTGGTSSLPAGTESSGEGSSSLSASSPSGGSVSSLSQGAGAASSMLASSVQSATSSAAQVSSSAWSASSASSQSSSSLSSDASSSSSQPAGDSRTVRFYSGRIICDAEDDAGAEAEFYGTCQVTASLEGAALQALDGGYPVTGYLWEVEPVWAEEWALQPGQWKPFNRQRIFSLPAASLGKCSFRIRAHVLENDTFGSDDLGWQELVFSGNAVPPGIAWLPAFSDGGTTARIGLMVSVE